MGTVKYTVSTLDAQGNILADLYDGSDAGQAETAQARGFAAMTQPSNRIAQVRTSRYRSRA